MTSPPHAFPPISDYAFLSDCHSLALVARDGSVEWAVFHRFDGRPVFARILDRERGGYFQIAATDPKARIERRYLPGTNVLETTFRTSTGVVTLTDFMPVEPGDGEVGQVHQLGSRHTLMRVIRGMEGQVEVALRFKPRFEYGLTTPYVTMLDDDLAMSMGSADALLLQSEIGPLERDWNGGLDAVAQVGEGEVAAVVTSWSTPSGPDMERVSHDQVLAELDQTIRFWEAWSEHTLYEGPYRDAVLRSALAIKGLTDGKTGAVIAAATTSLPEDVGGERNWDYRYTWIRDSTTMLAALIRLGHSYEARRFAKWIRDTTAGRASEVQLMYGIGGERILTETELSHLSGYRGSRPVRIGNGAWDQTQLDTYGWLVASAWFAAVHVRELGEPMDRYFMRFIDDVVEIVIKRFDEEDEGIWEVRSGPRPFLFSKLLMWLAVDVGIQLLERRQGQETVPDHWVAARDQMRERIEREGVDPERNVFTQSFGSKDLDASALQVGNLGFLPPDDPRILATIEAIDRELGVDGHIYRYRNEDGIGGDEGSFVFCTLWMVSALARSGQVERARERFEMVLSHTNDLGLLSEEIDPHTGELLGNFPQAFSHVGIITAAMAIKAAEESPDGLVHGSLDSI